MSTLQTAESIAALANQTAPTDGADARFKYLGRSGHIHGYDFIIPASGEGIVLSWGEKNPRTGRMEAKGQKHAVPNYGTNIAELMSRPGAAVGWARTDDFEVIGFYDKNDDNFGYSYNVTYDEGEWTYLYFG